MTVNLLNDAESEAHRFLHAIAILRGANKVGKWTVESSKESGAVRRASMDLTRALARLRKY